MKYEVRIEKAAARDLDRLPASAQRRVVPRIESLRDDPRPAGARPLGGKLRGLMKVRVGDYRVSYRIDDGAGEITIMQVGHRRDIYRRMERRGRS